MKDSEASDELVLLAQETLLAPYSSLASDGVLIKYFELVLIQK